MSKEMNDALDALGIPTGEKKNPTLERIKKGTYQTDIREGAFQAETILDVDDEAKVDLVRSILNTNKRLAEDLKKYRGWYNSERDKNEIFRRQASNISSAVVSAIRQEFAELAQRLNPYDND